MNKKSLEDIQKKLQSEFDNFKQVQKEHSKNVTFRQQMGSQLMENEIVIKELGLLKPENQVYKLVGPVLIKIDQEEAKQNVSKRIEYISAEIKRVEGTITTLDKKQKDLLENLLKSKMQFQQAQLKAAIQA